MALITNNRENQFHFHIKGAEYVIPAGKQGEKGFEPSSTSIDDAVMTAAAKNPVVAAWVADKAIEVSTSAAPAAAKAEEK